MSIHETVKELTIVAMQNGYILRTTDQTKNTERVMDFYKEMLKTVKENQ